MAKIGIEPHTAAHVYDSSNKEKGEFDMDEYAKKADIELLIEKKFNQLYLWNFGTIIGIAVLVFSALNYFNK